AAAFCRHRRGSCEAGFPAGSGSTGRFFLGDDLLFRMQSLRRHSTAWRRAPLLPADSPARRGWQRWRKLQSPASEDCSKPLCASAGSLEACRQRCASAPNWPDAVCQSSTGGRRRPALPPVEVVLTYRFRNASRAAGRQLSPASTSRMRSHSFRRRQSAAARRQQRSSVRQAASLRQALRAKAQARCCRANARCAGRHQLNSLLLLLPVLTGSKAAAYDNRCCLQCRQHADPYRHLGHTNRTTRLQATVTDWFDTEDHRFAKERTRAHSRAWCCSSSLIITLAVSLICWRPALQLTGEPQSVSTAAAGSRLRHGSVDATRQLDGPTRYLLLLQSRYSRPPPLLPGLAVPAAAPDPRSAHSFVSSPIYNEPDVAASAAAARSCRAASNGDSASSDYYAPAGHDRLLPAGGFFSRSQDSRRTLVSQPSDSRQVGTGSGAGHAGGGAARQLRAALSGSRGGYGEATVGISVGGYRLRDAAAAEGADPQSVRGDGPPADEQGRELQQLSKQVRASQQALSRLAASYHDLHRSVRHVPRAHPSSSPRHSPSAVASPAPSLAEPRPPVATPDSTEDPYATPRCYRTAAIGCPNFGGHGVHDSGGCQALGDLGGAARWRQFREATSTRPTVWRRRPPGGHPPAASGLGFVETINEELEAEDATLKPNKQQNQQQQQQP
uniref:Protein kinase domain-containing protein n=1 Tax=Macrostomum lignano TaxID=282301 RepID=A0A1I8FNZ9_9PLAT